MTGTGFDWPCCNREIIVGFKNSINELIQMIGRAFRYHPEKANGKTPVRIIQIIPWVDKNSLDKEDLRDQINNFMKVVYASLVLESVIDPVRINIPTSKDSEETSSYKYEEVMEYVRMEIGESAYMEAWSVVMDALIEYRHDHPDLENDVLERHYTTIIVEQLDNLDIEVYQEEIASIMLEAFKRRTNDLVKSLTEASRKLDIAHVDFDIMSMTDPIGFVVGYTNDLCGANTLEKFRDQVYISDADFKKDVQRLKAWKEKHGRFPLPNSEDQEEQRMRDFFIYCKTAEASARKEKRVW